MEYQPKDADEQDMVQEIEVEIMKWKKRRGIAEEALPYAEVWSLAGLVLELIRRARAGQPICDGMGDLGAKDFE